MHKSRPQKKELLIRFGVYGLMTITVVSLLVISLFYLLGYNINLQARTVEQSGLVQFITTPPNATVEIDHTTLSFNTPTKETVSAGMHEFVMWREGYETWRKQLHISSGTLTWLNYTRLIPKQRKVEVVHDLGNPAANLVSRDHRFMALLTDASRPDITIYDLTRETVAAPQAYTFASDTYTDATKPTGHQFSLIDWDVNGRFILIRHQYESGNEWLVFDRQGGKIRSNISRTMDIDIQDIVATDSTGDHYFALTNGDVRQIDLAAETVSRPLVNNVSSFSLDVTSGTIAYVEPPDAATGYRKVGIVKKGGKPVTMYRSDTALDTPLFIRAAHYFDKDYVTISEGKKVTIYSGNFPTNENDAMKKYAQFSAAENIASLNVSPTGRFVLAQYGSHFITYDIEREKLAPVANLPDASSPLRWLDDYMLWYEHGGIVTVREFDGANIHDLHALAPGYTLTLSQNGKYLYSVGAAENGHKQLQRLKMILN